MGEIEREEEEEEVKVDKAELLQCSETFERLLMDRDDAIAIKVPGSCGSDKFSARVMRLSRSGDMQDS